MGASAYIRIANPEQGAVAIQRAGALIRAGRLVAFPTETVYGLGANALAEPAVRAIYAAKARALDDPCIVHIAALDDLAHVADVDPADSNIGALVTALTQAFWPGPLSLILPRAAAIPPVVTGGRPTVAVRMPAHPVALALIRAAGVPIAAPSANRFMHISPTDAAHVRDDLDGRIDMILDAGSTSVGVESTVLDLTAAAPTILRPGGVSLERLRMVLGDVAGAEPAQGAAPRAASPGLLETHYAPVAPMVLYSGSPAWMRGEMERAARVELDRGRVVGALIADEDADELDPARLPGLVVARLGPQDDLDEVARRLYDGLRTLEERGADVIVARSFARDGIGQAIADRMRRAAGGRVIEEDTSS